MEEWRPFPHDIYGQKYDVSNAGRVRVRATGHIMSPYRSGPLRHGARAYPCVRLDVNGTRQSFTIHRAVAKVFCRRPTGADQVNHIDGNKLNGSAENLEWTTASENIRHAVRTRLIPSGESRCDAKVDARCVQLIRQLTKFGKCPQADVAVAFGVSQSLVSRIVCGKCWKQLNA